MRLIKLFFILIFIGSNSVLALPSDENQQAILAANTADLNQQTHQGIYTGDVQFDQGTRHLRAEKAITQGNSQNKLTWAIIYGHSQKLAHYWEQLSLDKPIMHAYAKEIRYYPEKHLIELIGEAKIIQGNDSFSAPKISYDTLKQHVTSHNEGTNRTLIVIHPGQS